MHWICHLKGGPHRVNHAAVAVGSMIYSFGGYCTGDSYSSGKIDVFILDTDTLRWFPLTYTADSLQAIPFNRYGHTVVAYGTKIYLWGGRNDVHSTNTLHCFDTRTMKWSLPQVSGLIPKAADGHSACVIGEHMYLFGGYQEETETFSDTPYRLSFSTLVWEKLRTKGALPQGVDFHTATAIGDRMYIFGGRGVELTQFGYRTECYENPISYLDTKTMTWVRPATQGNPPCGRRSHSAVLHDGKLYIICGYNSLENHHFGDMYKFDPEENFWSSVLTMGESPCPRRRQCCCVVGNKLYLFGGTSPTDALNGNESGDADSFNDFDGDLQKLYDHSDLLIMDFYPTLTRICMKRIIDLKLDYRILPHRLKLEIRHMSTDNCIYKLYDYPVHGFSDFSSSA